MKSLGLAAITIESIKGMGQAVTIPPRPVTLLFCANSAGKSTIIQAPQYARENVENRNPDVGRTRFAAYSEGIGPLFSKDFSRPFPFT